MNRVYTMVIKKSIVLLTNFPREEMVINILKIECMHALHTAKRSHFAKMKIAISFEFNGNGTKSLHFLEEQE